MFTLLQWRQIEFKSKNGNVHIQCLEHTRMDRATPANITLMQNYPGTRTRVGPRLIERHEPGSFVTSECEQVLERLP